MKFCRFPIVFCAILTWSSLASATCGPTSFGSETLALFERAAAQADRVRIVKNPSEIDGIAKLAVRIFTDDPLFNWIAPNLTKREWFIKTMIKQTFLRGRIFVNSDTEEPQGFALWIPSKLASAGPVDMMRNTQAGYVLTISPIHTVKLLMLDSYLTSTRLRLTGDSAAPYLFLIGVAPEAQRQGIGTRLIGPVIEEAKLTQTPVVLEIQKPSNIPYYERFGFQGFASRNAPPSAPISTTMVFKPEKIATQAE